MKKLNIFILFFGMVTCAYSQQEAQYTQYMYNLGIVNPAYTSAEIGILNIGGMYRSQWKNIKGAPITKTIFLRTPLSKKITTGISFIQDEIGTSIVKNNIYGDVAYKLPLSLNSNLSLGIKFGVASSNIDVSRFKLESGDISTDPAFNNIDNNTSFSLGFGAFYVYKNFYFGASIPNFVSDLASKSSENVTHYYLTSGYVYQLTNNIKLKPSMLFKGTFNVPFSIDLSLNVLFYEMFELGGSYRLEDSFSIMTNLKILPFMRIGYAYDLSISELKKFNSGSHEILLLLDLNLIGKGYKKSPRYF